MSKVIQLGLVPTRQCNGGCNYCYLTKAERNDKAYLDLDVLDARLKELLNRGYFVEHSMIYGGEPLLLPTSYLQEMLEVLHRNGVMENEIVTNLTVYNEEVLENRDFDITVCYDFGHRPTDSITKANLVKMERGFILLTQVTAELIKKDPTELILEAMELNNVLIWELREVYKNEYHQDSLTHKQFADYVLDVIRNPIKLPFPFMNSDLALEAVTKQLTTYQDDNIFIVPSGNFGSSVFDGNDIEGFQEFKNFEEYLAWTNKEKERIKSVEACSGCKFNNHCLVEYFHQPKAGSDGCYGHRDLLEWGLKNVAVLHK